MFKHKIVVNSSSDPMEAEGLLTILRDDEFVRIVDDKGNPVLTVARGMVLYIESTPIHNTHEHVEASKAESTPVERDEPNLRKGASVEVEFGGTVTDIDGDWIYVERDDALKDVTPPYPGATNATRLVVHKRLVKLSPKSTT